MKKHGHLVYFIGALLGLIATLTVFLPSLGYRPTDTTFTGFQVVTLYTFASLGSFGNGFISFSIFNFLAYVLPMIASIVLIFVKRGYIISLFCFFISFVLFFLMKEITEVTITVMNSTSHHSIDWAMEYGIYIALVATGLGVVITLYQSVLSFRNGK